MSTAGNQRLTRSASKARSTGAGSTGVPSVAASGRVRSRRGGSTAPLADDDKPAIGNQVTRAYGTEGRSAEAHLLSAEVGTIQAVNPIANAVFQAQGPEPPVVNTPSRLPVLEEEPEDREDVRRPPSEPVTPDQIRRMNTTPGRRPYSIDSSESEPPAKPSFFSWAYWGPHRDRFGQEGPNRTANNVIAGSLYGRRYRNDRDEIQFNDDPWGFQQYLGFFAYAVIISLVLFILFSTYETNKAIAYRRQVEAGNVSATTFTFLQHRITKLDQHVQSLLRATKSVEVSTTKHQINWFTPGFGTAIDVDLSSPTASDCDPTWTPNGWPWSMLKSQTCPQIALSESHFAALSPWSDPVDDSWCAPPSNGKLQLTVVLRRNIAPTELVVEHAAMDEMPVGLMGSSPREVELWIHIPDDTTRAILVDAITQTTPSLLQDSSPQGKILGDDQALPFDFVPVGRWEYNIKTNQRVQTFAIPIPLAHYGVSTAKVAVRVNSNWGNVKSTCLSRLRLHGDDASGFTEALE